MESSKGSFKADRDLVKFPSDVFCDHWCHTGNRKPRREAVKADKVVGEVVNVNTNRTVRSPSIDRPVEVHPIE